MSDSGRCLRDCPHGYTKGECWRCENDQLRRQIVDKESQVAQLTLERDGCRDLIATLRTKLADAEATAWELRSNKEASDGK